MTERLYTVGQVAQLLGASQEEVADWMQRGWLSYRRLPEGPLRVSEKNLVHFLKDRGIDIEMVMAGAGDGQWSQASTQPVEPAAPIAPRETIDLSAAPQAHDSPASEDRLMFALPSPSIPSDAEPPADIPPSFPPSAGPPADVPAEAPAVEVEPEVAAPEPLPPNQTIPQIAQALLRDAIARRAEEIHFEPSADGLALRLRIDGVLHDRPSFKAHLPQGVWAGLIDHLKALGGLDVGQRRRAQHGRLHVELDEGGHGFRIVSCPTRHGERITLMALDAPAGQADLGALGLGEPDEQRVRDFLAAPGIVVLAGPPNSGKSNTLRAMIAELATPARLVALVENQEGPVMLGVAQTVADPVGGLGVADAVDAYALQSADVIAVGEVNSWATCRAMLDAARGGSLVLAAVNASDCLGALDLLLQAGLDRWALAASLTAVIAQRTIRRLCPHCKRPVAPGDGLDNSGLRADEPQGTYAAVGCPACSKTGYAGRTGVFSIMEITGNVATLIRQGAGIAALGAAADEAGRQSLRQAGLEKVRGGITSAEELARILPKALISH